MFNFNHLYYFYIVAKSQNSNTAASHLRISQPSLSHQLKVLEEMLQIKLFRREGRSNKLTERGHTVFSYCQKMFSVAEELHESFVKNIPPASRKIYLGVSKEIHQRFIVESVDRFFSAFDSRERPQIVLSTSTHQQLIERLKLREFDLILTEKKDSEEELMCLLEIVSPVFLAGDGPFFKKLTEKKRKLIQKLMQENLIPWVMPPLGFKLRQEIELFFEVNKMEVRPSFESDDMGALLRSVGSGMGSAFMPQVYFQKEINEKTISSYGPTEGFWEHRLWLYGHVQSKGDSQIEALVQAFYPPKEFNEHL